MASHGPTVPSAVPSLGRKTWTSVCGTKTAPPRRTGSSRRGTSASRTRPRTWRYRSAPVLGVERDELAGRRVADEVIVDREPRRSDRRDRARRRPDGSARRAVERGEAHALAIANGDDDRLRADERRALDRRERARGDVELAALIGAGKGCRPLHGAFERVDRVERAGAGHAARDREEHVVRRLRRPAEAKAIAHAPDDRAGLDVERRDGACRHLYK